MSRPDMKKRILKFILENDIIGYAVLETALDSLKAEARKENTLIAGLRMAKLNEASAMVERAQKEEEPG